MKAKYKAGEHVRNVRMVYATPMLLSETPGTIVRASEHRGTQARYLVAFDDVRTGPRNLWVDQDQLERMRKANPRRKRRRAALDRLVTHSSNPRRRRTARSGVEVERKGSYQGVPQWGITGHAEITPSRATAVKWARLEEHAKRRTNPRSPLFKLLAHKRTGGKRLVYVGAAKFSEAGRPVYFKTPEGAKVVARLLRLQFPMLKRYAFSIAGA